MTKDRSMKYSFTWKIENFLLCDYENGQEMTSPAFTPEIFEGSKWTINLFPKGRNEDCLDYISCYLCKRENDKNSETIPIDYTMEICGIDGKVLKSKTYLALSFMAGNSFGRRDFLKISEVEDAMMKLPEDTLTITCHLFSGPKHFESVANTKFRERKHSFLWNVKMPGETPERKLIPFSDNLQFEISVTAPDDDINIVICMKKNKFSLKRNLVSKMALLNLKGSEVSSKCASHLFESENEHYQHPILMKKGQLMANKSSYIEEDCFSLWGEFSVSDGIEYSKIQDSETDNIFKTNATIENLQEDFLNMFLDKKHADAQLRVNNEIIPVHKSVLSARSAVFDAMFSQDMIESKTGVVEILDVDVKTMTSFLEYVYSGMLKNIDYESAKRLLTLADKYQVDSLKEKCADFLISSMSLRNVCDIFAIADLVLHEQLKRSAMKYIISNSSKVLVSLEWKELLKNNPMLASDVISNIAVNFKFTPLNRTTE